MQTCLAQFNKLIEQNDSDSTWERQLCTLNRGHDGDHFMARPWCCYGQLPSNLDKNLGHTLDCTGK